MAATSNPYGLLEAGSPTLGNGSLFVPPNFNNMPAAQGGAPGFGYSSLLDQMRDGIRMQGQGSGLFQGMNTPLMQGIANSQPTVGGGLLGATAYSGNNPWTGWDPYAGRGNGPPPGTGGPGGPPPGGPPGGGTPPPGGPPPGGGTPPPGGPPIVRQPPGANPPGWTSGPPPGFVPPPPSFGGSGGKREDPSRPPSGPPSSITPNPGTLQPPGTPGTRTPNTGLLSPGAPTTPYTGLAPGAMSTGAMPYQVSQITSGGTGDQSPAAMAQYFMSLPEGQRGDYFNAVGQMGALTGNNAGSALDQALRATMGDSAFKNWLTTMDTQQGSSIRSTDGLPSWITSVLR